MDGRPLPEALEPDPARRAYRQNPEAVWHWLEVEYPEVCKQASLEGAEIHWGNEMEVRSDHQTG